MRQRRPLRLLPRLPRAIFLTALGTSLVVSACGDDPVAARPIGDDASSTDAARSPEDAGDLIPDVDTGSSEFGLDVRPTNTSCKPKARPRPLRSIVAERAFPNLVLPSLPMMMTQPPNDPSRWYVAMWTTGAIVSFPNAPTATTTTVVGNISTLSGIPMGVYGESGFLGLAFHPKFAQNGRLYVSWNSEDGPFAMRSRIGYVMSNDGGATFTSYTNLIAFDQPNVGLHHGGGIAFGPDGYLYASFGDGADSPKGQITSSLFAKVIRIDVDNIPVGQTYGIPADNPFAAGGGDPATFAFGFRNPFRFSFDRKTGDLWVGDVGHQLYEEVDLVKRGGNYGWECREGFHDFLAAQTRDLCLSTKRDAIDPIFETPHNGTAHALIGGYIYRGPKVPALVGSYVFADYPPNEAFVAQFDPVTGAPVLTKIGGTTIGGVGAFAEGTDGELYALNFGGQIHTLAEEPVSGDPDAGAPAAPSFATRLSETGCDPRTATGMIPYDVNVPSWNDGLSGDRSIAIPDGATIAVLADGRFVLPIGSVVTQTLSENNKRIETRILVRHDDGKWSGYAYEWLDDQSDAFLLPASSRKTVAAPAASHSWLTPSRAECIHCHSAVAGSTLGLELGQWNRDFRYATTNRVANQLKTLAHVGVFASPLSGPPSDLVRYAPQTSTNEPVEQRARAYLHSNCSMCHRSDNTAMKSTLDLRFATTLAATKTCNVDAITGDLGVNAPKLLSAGAPLASQLAVRVKSLDARRMPPRGSDVVDTSGAALLEAWITSVAACPP